MGKIDLKKKIGEDGQIIDQNVIHRSIDNGIVELKIHYTVVEDIVKTTPVLQED